MVVVMISLGGFVARLGDGLGPRGSAGAGAGVASCMSMSVSTGGSGFMVEDGFEVLGR